MTLSFKNRIALFTALAAALTIGFVFLMVYGVVYFSAYNHLDEDIYQEKEEVLNNLRLKGDSIIIESLPEWDEKEHQQTEVNPVFLQVVDKNGKLLFRSSNLRESVLLFNPATDQDAFFNSHIENQRVRQGQFPILNEQNFLIGHLSVGLSSQESSIVLHNLRNTLWAAFPALLLVLFWATSFAASKGITPVQQLIKAASVIDENHISNKLPLPETKDEIHQLAAAFNELLHRIDNSMQREKQFTADASHEIRTPLTAIRGTLEVLIRKQREPAQYQEKISQVIREVDRLHAMLDQLLQLARLEGGRTSVHEIPLQINALLASAADKWQPRLAEKNMALHFDIPPSEVVTTDPDLLGVVVDNIIGNAIKYGRNGGRIDCLWETGSRSLIIRDDGPGIPPEQLPYVFDRFYRTDDSRSSSVPGTGLGLAIAKKMSDLLNIRLTANNAKEAGAEFILRFPF
ncbi:MAG: HAMP domain-containing histidine kinase [Saprospiraceae bacterium]|nr:HAMP domain-containing histidine kinase [Saprospiraceae bacterium]HRD81388.1 ATP-binding protein [Saprospiraceae bacterium]HRF38573.1 ATP-binding protein [Saprospiraceae bacterium]HRJ15640.1 ATP-binding protein [Saprospiraceae bacterium]HRK81021.1 ATP-binding protein [Saprospiraceae bacterium]